MLAQLLLLKCLRRKAMQNGFVMNLEKDLDLYLKYKKHSILDLCLMKHYVRYYGSIRIEVRKAKIMATGITSNNWKEDTHIITDEVFTEDIKYELQYKGKLDEIEILNLKTKTIICILVII
jgi:hypothetical protein